MYRVKIVALLGIALLLLAACAEEGDPTQAIQDYLNARVAGDEDKMSTLACADWEANVSTEADSFRGMEAQIEDMACETGDEDGDYTLINCDGKIVTTYNGETREWELGTYRAIQEDGEWKMCGEG